MVRDAFLKGVRTVEKERNNTYKALGAGVGAVFIWAIGPAFVRTLSEGMGVMSSGAISAIGGGILALLYKKYTTKKDSSYGKVSWKYWVICGISMLIFTLGSALSVGLSETREQVISTGLIRSMWPPITLLLTIPINKKKASPWFAVCFSASVVGMAIANLNPNCRNAAEFFAPFLENSTACILALASSIAWGIYSNYLEKYIRHPSQDYVGVLMIVAGIVEIGLSFVLHEEGTFHMNQLGELLFMVVASSFLASILWNAAMSGSKKMSCIILSNFLPVISTVLVSLMLGVSLTWPVVVGSLLVVAGTIGSNACFKQTSEKVQEV